MAATPPITRQVSFQRPARVLIVDDHPVVREVVALACGERPALEVVGEASDGPEALEKCRCLDPDVMVLDLGLPSMSGFDVMMELRAEGHPVRVLVLTGRGDQAAVFQSLQLGASGFLVKTCSVRDIAAAVEAVAGGTQVFSLDHQQAAHSELRALARRTRRASAALATLTPREVEVLEMIALGYTSRQMGSRLGIAERTVTTHIGHLYMKLGVQSRVQALHCAAELGVVDLDPLAGGRRTLASHRSLVGAAKAGASVGPAGWSSLK
jgi:DNA-binding NarL/FixJ family response regulator